MSGMAEDPSPERGAEGAPGPSSPQRPLRRSTNPFLRAWAWKREGRPDKVRFHRPYLHELALPDGSRRKLVIKQAKFEAEGFASTVWDSSIVVSRYAEHSGWWHGKRVLDLSAGCGLVALTLAGLGARVVATDLGPNLPLLRANVETNGFSDDIEVVEHVWGTDASALGEPFDAVFACDTMYVAEAVPALVETLRAVSRLDSLVVVAYGRNRQAEDLFLARAKPAFHLSIVSSRQLHPDFQTSDVAVMRLRPRKKLRTGHLAKPIMPGCVGMAAHAAGGAAPAADGAAPAVAATPPANGHPAGAAAPPANGHPAGAAAPVPAADPRPHAHDASRRIAPSCARHAADAGAAGASPRPLSTLEAQRRAAECPGCLDEVGNDETSSGGSDASGDRDEPRPRARPPPSPPSPSPQASQGAALACRPASRAGAEAVAPAPMASGSGSALQKRSIDSAGRGLGRKSARLEGTV